MKERFNVVTLMIAVSTCQSASEPAVLQIAAEAQALTETRVSVRFSQPLQRAPDANAIRIFGALQPEKTLTVNTVQWNRDELELSTATQEGGCLYALDLGPLYFEATNTLIDAPKQINFIGFGKTDVVIRLDVRGRIYPDTINALITVDTQSGRYSETLQTLPMFAESPGVFSSTVGVQIDPGRLFAVGAETSEGIEAAPLQSFSVDTQTSVRVDLLPLLPKVPEFFPPVDSAPNNGRAVVRIIIDDRPARALTAASLKISADQNGQFDASLNRQLTLETVAGYSRVYEAIFEVAVDPARKLDGANLENFPYVSYLVEGGADFPARGINFVAPDETPQLHHIVMGNPNLVPVTFRIDVGHAFLSPNGEERGLYADEALFLTGEFPSAEDALGRTAADAFTGGERDTLQMVERSDAPGIYEKTIFLPPNRPYGWKVVRCPHNGCAELNRHVISSGRAFPTVMKNLVTANQDAAQFNAVRLVDPQHLDTVLLENGETADYRQAVVSQEGNETSSAQIMFKQEAPDLVVRVGTEPVITPVYVVGTWRDINIPETPRELIESGKRLDLSAYDYDDGLAGREPLIRDIELPLEPTQGP